MSPRRDGDAHLATAPLANVVSYVVRCLLLLILLGSFVVEGRQSYQSLFPNGDKVYRNGQYWGGVGHNNAAGGLSLNSFGSDFSNSFDWPTICPLDSDGDSFSNGMELGDPGCTWTQGSTPSRTTGITHPGFADSFPTTAAPPPPGTTSSATTAKPTTLAPPTPSPAPPVVINHTTIASATFSVVSGLALSWIATANFVYVTQSFQTGAYGSFASSSSGMNGLYLFASVSSGTPRCALYSGTNYDVNPLGDQSGVAVFGGSVTGSTATVTCNVSRSALAIHASSSQRMIFATGKWVGVPLQHSGSGKVSATVNIDAGTLVITKSSRYIIGWGVMIGLFGVWMIAGFCASSLALSVMTMRVIQAAAALSILGSFISVFLAYRADYVAIEKSDGDALSFGWAATAGFAMVLLPTAKHAAVSRIFASAYERMLWLHPLIGFLLFISATVHMGMMYNMGKDRTSGQIAWAIVAFMVIMGSIRQYAFRWFRYTHFIFVLALLFTGLHVGKTFLWIVLPGIVIWVVDVVLRLRNQLSSSPKLVSLRNVLGNSTVTEVQIAVDWKDPPTPGQYCFLGVEHGIAHPFSVASYVSSTKTATFYCKSVGPMTKELATLAEGFTSDKAGKSVVCLGPYGSPQFDLCTVDGLLLIAGGIGVTPILYTLQWLVRNGSSLNLTHLVLVWSAREEQLATSLQPFIDSQLKEIGGKVTLQAHIMVTATTTSSPTIRQGRPDVVAIAKDLKMKVGDSRKIGLFCCGPEPMMDACTDAAVENGFLLHKETFSF